MHLLTKSQQRGWYLQVPEAPGSRIKDTSAGKQAEARRNVGNDIGTTLQNLSYLCLTCLTCLTFPCHTLILLLFQQNQMAARNPRPRGPFFLQRLVLICELPGVKDLHSLHSHSLLSKTALITWVRLELLSVKIC